MLGIYRIPTTCRFTQWRHADARCWMEPRCCTSPTRSSAALAELWLPLRVPLDVARGALRGRRMAIRAAAAAGRNHSPGDTAAARLLLGE